MAIYNTAQAAKAMASRLGVDLSDEASYDPQAQVALAGALSFRSQNHVEKAQTLDVISKLSNQYSEFGMGGVFGELATSVSDKEKTPSQMTDKELREGISASQNSADNLKNMAIVAKNPWVSGAFSSAEKYFRDGNKRMKDELKTRNQERLTAP